MTAPTVGVKIYNKLPVVSKSHDIVKVHLCVFLYFLLVFVQPLFLLISIYIYNIWVVFFIYFKSLFSIYFM